MSVIPKYKDFLSFQVHKWWTMWWEQSTYLSPLCKRHKAGHSPMLPVTNTHCLGWENKSVLMWYAVMSFCWAAASRGSGTQFVLQGWWKSAEQTKPWIAALFQGMLGLCHRNKEKACYLLYFHRKGICPLWEKGKHSLCLNPTVRFNNPFLCFVWSALLFWGYLLHFQRM